MSNISVDALDTGPAFRLTDSQVRAADCVVRFLAAGPAEAWELLAMLGLAPYRRAHPSADPARPVPEWQPAVFPVPAASDAGVRR